MLTGKMTPHEEPKTYKNNQYSYYEEDYYNSVGTNTLKTEKNWKDTIELAEVMGFDVNLRVKNKSKYTQQIGTIKKIGNSIDKDWNFSTKSFDVIYVQWDNQASYQFKYSADEIELISKGT